jgi:hypothetical protein
MALGWGDDELKKNDDISNYVFNRGLPLNREWSSEKVCVYFFLSSELDQFAIIFKVTIAGYRCLKV